MLPDEAVKAAERMAGELSNNPLSSHEMKRIISILEAAAPHLMTPARVTTEDELDALPAWSVVLSEAYTHHESNKRISFQRWGDGSWHRGGRSASTHPDNFLPATVLHIGDSK